jgi:hypothetical protein
MDDAVTVALKGGARTALFGLRSAAEFAHWPRFGIGSIGGAGHHGQGD